MSLSILKGPKAQFKTWLTPGVAHDWVPVNETRQNPIELQKDSLKSKKDSYEVLYFPSSSFLYLEWGLDGWSCSSHLDALRMEEPKGGRWQTGGKTQSRAQMSKMTAQPQHHHTSQMCECHHQRANLHAFEPYYLCFHKRNSWGYLHITVLVRTWGLYAGIPILGHQPILDRTHSIKRVAGCIGASNSTIILVPTSLG